MDVVDDSVVEFGIGLDCAVHNAENVSMDVADDTAVDFGICIACVVCVVMAGLDEGNGVEFGRVVEVGVEFDTS